MQLDTWVTKQKNAEKKEITKLRTTIWLLRLAAVILPANEIAEPFYWQLTRGVSRQAAATRQQAGRQTRLCRRDAYQKMWGPSNWHHAFYEYRLFGIRHGVQTVSKCNPVSVSVSVSVSITGSFSTTNTKAKNKHHNYFLCTAFAVTLNADLWVLS